MVICAKFQAIQDINSSFQISPQIPHHGLGLEHYKLTSLQQCFLALFCKLNYKLTFILVPLATIKEVRSGKNTEVFRTIDRDDIPEDCAFSIIHGDDFIVLDLIAHSSDDANIWITGLRCLLDSDLGKLGK